MAAGSAAGPAAVCPTTIGTSISAQQVPTPRALAAQFRCRVEIQNTGRWLTSPR
jgi:hypothetical protein